MRAGPKAASASASEPATGVAALARFPAARRLLSPRQFVAVTSDPSAWRKARRWLAIACRVDAGDSAGQGQVRFGFTAAKRNARRAVDRNTVKRVLREAAREHLAELDGAAGPRPVDIVLRLKASVPARAALSKIEWKAALRIEADALLAQLARELRRAPPASE